MTDYRDMHRWSSKPLNGQIPVFNESIRQMDPTTATTLVIAGTHIAAVSVTSSQNATDTLAGLQTSYNAAQIDIAALIASYNTLLTELQTAGILASSS